MDRSEIATALEITPQIYQAALRFEEWGAVLDRMLPVFGARAAQVILGDPVRLEVVAMTHAGLSEAEVRTYMAVSNHADDPRIPLGRHMPNRPFSERTLMPEKDWLESSYFRDFFAPSGFDSTLIVFSPIEESGLVASLGLIRTLGEDPFTPADADRLQLYIPHFRAAMKVAGLVRRLEAEARSFACVFDALRMATLITDRFGRIRYANPAAATLLGDERGVRLRDDRLVAEDPETTRLIHGAAFDAALAADLPGEGRHVIPVRARNGAAPLLLAVSPVDAAMRGTDPVTEPLAAIFLLDPEARYEGDVEALERLYGLTRAEAVLMQQIAAGRRMQDIARSTGRSIETLRTHLKAVHAKTGAQRQADLVRMVAQISDPLRPPC